MVHSSSAKIIRDKDMFRKSKTSAPDKSELQIQKPEGKKPISSKTSVPDKAKKTSKSLPSKTQQVLSKKSRIPAFDNILTVENGTIPLPEKLRNHYVAIAESNNRVTIYCDHSRSLSPHLDNTYQQIHRKCKNLEYKSIVRALATPNIISIIYTMDRSRTAQNRKAENNKYVKEYTSIISRALELGCTDIHIEVRRDSALLRFRTNGRLVNMEDWDVASARRVAGLIYTVIASEKEINFNEHEPQSAIVDDVIDGIAVRLRLNTLNAYPKGFDMTMRVLRMGMTVSDVSLDSLGYAPYQLKDILRMKAKPNGAIIVAGVTGSGKSTTNTVLLSSIIKDNTDDLGCEIKVITVEDPPEYEIPGATQVPVVRSKSKDDENPFAATMRACLRMDPDILLVGEVRDGESAELMQHAIQSGHMVYTTIHAQHAFAIPTRMKGMGLTDDVIGSQGFLAGLIYQALVKECCAICSYTLDEALCLKEFNGNPEFMDMAERIKKVPNGPDGWSNVRIRRKGGCDKCNGGVIGRSVVAETVDITDELIEFFSRGEYNEARRHFRDNGGKFVVDHALEKVMEGLVDPRDAEAKVGPLIPSAFEVDNGFTPSDPSEDELGEAHLVSETYKAHPVTPLSQNRPKAD